MSSEFNPITPRTSVLLLGTALLATAGTLGSVLALANHYDGDYLQVAKAQSAVATLRAQAPATAPASTAIHG